MKNILQFPPDAPFESSSSSGVGLLNRQEVYLLSNQSFTNVKSVLASIDLIQKNLNGNLV